MESKQTKFKVETILSSLPEGASLESYEAALNESHPGLLKLIPHKT